MNDMTHAESGAPSSSEVPEFIGQVVATISSALDAERIGTGRLAELRRMEWRKFPPSFWNFYLKIVPVEWRQPEGRDDDRVDLAWASLLRAMAEAAPDPHRYDKSKTFGAVLAETGYAESRFVRFLRAEDRDLAREARTAAAWLAGAGRKANWREPAELILGRIGRFGRFGHGLEIHHPDTVTHRLARGYFRVQTASS